MAISQTIVIFLIALTAGLLLRFWQFPHIDFETGFFKADTAGGLIAAFYAVIVAAFAALLIYGILQRRKPAREREPLYRRHHVSEHFAVAAGISAFAAGASLIIQLLFGLIFAPAPDHGGMSAPGLFDFISGDAATAVLTLLAAFAYSVIGFTLTVRRQFRPAAGAAQVLLALYFTAGAASVFNKHLVIKEMSNPLIILLTDICAVLFFFGMGRIFARTESKSTRCVTAAFGLLTALLSITECVSFWLFLRNADSNTLAILTGETAIDGINPQIDIPPVPLIVQGFTVLMLLLLMNSSKKKQRIIEHI